MAQSHEDLHLGAAVYSSDGKHVGSLERVLIHERDKELRHIVLRESPIASGHHWYQGANMLIHEVMVPAEAITSAAHDRIDLSLSLRDVRHLPPYLAYQYAGAGSAQLLAAEAGGGPAWTYTESAHKPRGELEIEKGENVMYRHSGKVLGHVHDLVFDDHELTGVVIRPHGLVTHDVLIQVRFFDRSDDEALFAHITEDEVKQLQELATSD